MIVVMSSSAWAQRGFGGVQFPTGAGLIRNGAKGNCLDVAGWNGAGDGNVLLWECNGDPDQLWTFSPTGEVINALGYCLDVAAEDGAPGRNVDVHGCDRADDQKWAMARAGMRRAKAFRG